MIRVLYAEDEPSLAKIVRETLESRGFEVALCATGTEALASFHKQRPDVCVLDIMLPGRSGYEVAEAIRSADKSIPVIFLSAKTQTADVLQGFESGGNDYVRKPFSLEELIARIGNALRDRKETPRDEWTENIAIGEYLFNATRQTLTLSDNERKLSFRETELIKCLWKHRAGVINRNVVLEAIWGNDSFFNSRNLDVYITRLRSYFREDVSINIITVKGVGYRFVAGNT